MKKEDYKKRYLVKNSIFFRCQNCKKDIITKKWYQTKNLLYLCEECYNKLYN